MHSKTSSILTRRNSDVNEEEKNSAYITVAKMAHPIHQRAPKDRHPVTAIYVQR